MEQNESKDSPGATVEFSAASDSATMLRRTVERLREQGQYALVDERTVYSADPDIARLTGEGMVPGEIPVIGSSREPYRHFTRRNRFARFFGSLEF